VADPPLAQLRELAIDVGYELKMLGAVGPAVTPDAVPFLGFALLETSLLHLRNLDSFLGATIPAEDDVIALHYLATWEPTTILTDDEREDVNKRLMHLSRRRLRANAVWDRPTYAKRTLDVFDDFHAALRSKHPERAAWFDGDVAEARMLLNRRIRFALG
jgi:hypothetical protein